MFSFCVPFEPGGADSVRLAKDMLSIITLHRQKGNLNGVLTQAEAEVNASINSIFLC